LFGLLVCRRIAGGLGGLAACAAILAAWMFPRHKLFEPAIAMAAVWFGVRLLETPTRRWLFGAGAFTGLAAWFGRNHALYCILAFGLIIALLLRARRIQSTRQAFTSFVLGCAAGSAPLWTMLLMVPGFSTAYLDSIVFHFTQGVNIPLPYPWPWKMDLRGLQGFDLLAQIGIAVAFVLPLVVYPVGLIIALRTQPDRLAERAPMISAASAGIFYVHHVAVRSDAPHLAQIIHPLLILSLAISACMSPRRAPRLATLVLMGTVTLFATLDTNPSFVHLRPDRNVQFVVHDVAGDRLKLPRAQAVELANIETALRSRIGKNEALFVAPAAPGFYPIFDTKSPSWWLYFLWSATDAAQRSTIERLEAASVRWAYITDDAIDGREALRFRNSNPQVWDYLNRSFVEVRDGRLPPGHRLLRRRN
jgi:hypothetical protein